MGQYYNQITESKDESGKTVRKYYTAQTSEWLDSGKKNYEYYNGLKLMEHSWWNNLFVKRLAASLVDKPAKVAWVGDYAEDKECEALGFSYSDVCGDNAKYEYPGPVDWSMDNVSYLVNNTKKEYVDLKDYKERSNDGGWIINPIPLLTAVGNGRGGGDYHKGGTCYDLVGTWAFNEIYLTNDKPEGYELLDLYFQEG